MYLEKRLKTLFNDHSANSTKALTKVKATFRYDHIDRAPLGNMAGTLTTLIAGNPDVDFIYTHKVDDNTFKLDMREIRELSDRSTVEPHMVLKLARSINQALNRLEQT